MAAARGVARAASYGDTMALGSTGNYVLNGAINLLPDDLLNDFSWLPFCSRSAGQPRARISRRSSREQILHRRSSAAIGHKPNFVPVSFYKCLRREPGTTGTGAQPPRRGRSFSHVISSRNDWAGQSFSLTMTCGLDATTATGSVIDTVGQRIDCAVQEGIARIAQRRRVAV